MFKRCLTNSSKMFQKCLKMIKNALNMLQKCFKNALKNAPKMVQKCFKNASKMLKKCFKHVSKMLQKCFKKCSKMILAWWCCNGRIGNPCSLKFKGNYYIRILNLMVWIWIIWNTNSSTPQCNFSKSQEYRNSEISK